MVLTAAYGALRFGEVAGLRRRDVQLRKLKIDGAVTQVKGKVERVDDPKTEGSLREVSIPAFLADEIAQHMDANKGRPDSLIFPAPEGRPLSHTTFRSRYWIPALKAIGFGEWVDDEGGRRFVPSSRFHDLRHAGVAMAIRKGAHPKVIQTWVGHSDIGTTMNVYGHLYDDAETELADSLDDLRTVAREDAAYLRPEGAGEVVPITEGVRNRR